MGSAIKSVTGGLFGGSDSAGVMGTGQYRGKEYKINNDAFDPTKVASYGQEQQARGNQSDFIRQLQAQMQGQGPSLANMQLQQATNRNIAQTMGQAASQRGVNPALAARLAMNNVAGANQQAAMDSGIIRQQEMLNAQQQLGSQIGAQRQGDLAAVDRDLGAKMGREQLGVQQQTGLNNVNQQGYEGAAARRGNMISGLGQAAMMMSDEQAKTNVKDGESKVQKFVDSFRKATVGEEAASQKPKGHEGAGMAIGQGIMKMFGSGGGGATAMAASDEKSKTKKGAGGDNVKSFLDAINANSYEYKEEFKDKGLGGEGTFVSPMAQELEKTELGKSMVIDTPEGKVVDYGKGFGAMLASQAMLNDRLKKLEGKRKV
jgi:hypothetical protein